jgi:hypothetical protein
MIGTINILGVFVGAIISMVVGMAWYSPYLFGKRFMKLVDPSESQAENMHKNAIGAYTKSFISYLVLSFVLQLIVHEVGTLTFLGGMTIGFVLWLGCVLPVTISTVLYENRLKGLAYLNLFYHLVIMIIIGGVMAVWF